MGIKVKAVERNIAYASKNAGKEVFAFVMQPELYGQLAENKVIEQAALNTGLPKAVMETAVKGYGAVVGIWATEGHSIPIPGLGTMRFGVRAKSVSSVDDVKASLITSRRVIFTPNVEVKKMLAETSVSITCYDRNGNIVKSVTSDDKDDVEDPENPDNKDNTGAGGSGSDTGKGDNTGSGSTEDSGKGDQGGTSNPGSSSTGDDNELV